MVPDLVGLFIGPLEALGFRYMITGGVASVIYGDPRFTRDVDVVLELVAADVERFASGLDHEILYVPPLETLAEEVGRPEGGHFNLIHRESALRADVYLAGEDPLHGWALGRRRRVALDDGGLWLAPIEYVILRKLEYYGTSGSDRHLRDVAAMLRASGGIVDRVELDAWIERLRLERAWRDAEAFETG